ncbi:hypothetical protein DNTS_015403, partial [Danionella cerebrum]
RNPRDAFTQHQEDLRKMSAASERVSLPRTARHRQVSKPLMEKKRRARINKCLNELKILLESVCSSRVRKRKLEKADILELTVEHLEHLRSSARGISQTSVSAEFQSGYRSCLASAHRFLLTSSGDGDRGSAVQQQLLTAAHHCTALENEPALILTAEPHSSISQQTPAILAHTASSRTSRPPHLSPHRSSAEEAWALKQRYWRPW